SVNTGSGCSGGKRSDREIINIVWLVLGHPFANGDAKPHVRRTRRCLKIAVHQPIDRLPPAKVATGMNATGSDLSLVVRQRVFLNKRTGLVVPADFDVHVAVRPFAAIL